MRSKFKLNLSENELPERPTFFTMKYNPLGSTGLKVSSLSFGASSLGGVFREVNEADAIRAVHTALDLGINYFDVAPAYGATRSEAVLGKALKGIPRDRYILSTKVGKIHQRGCLWRRYLRLFRCAHSCLVGRKWRAAGDGLL